MRLSAIILTKNSQKDIKECIETLSFADEVLVVDSKSEDKTLEIAKKLNVRIVVHESNNFAKQRTFASKLAKGDWIFYVDADERVSDDLRVQIITTINKQQSTNNKIVAYKVQRKNYYLGNHEWPEIEQMERLFLKSRLIRWHGAVHESPEIDGSVGLLSGYLLHYTHSDLGSMLAKTNEWSDIESDLIIASGHPSIVWWRFLRIMLTRFVDSYFCQGGWKVGTAGLIESIFQAYSYFIIYAKAWEKQQHGKNQ